MNKISWQPDLLNREEEGKFLIDYLLKRHKQNKDSNFVLNINAEWGFGKTYFLENLTLDLKEKKHPVIYFDAWKNDFSDEPLLAFISEIESQLTQYFSKATGAKKTVMEKLNKLKKSAKPMLGGFIANRAARYGLDVISDDTTDEETKENDDTSRALERSVEKATQEYAKKALLQHQSIKKSIEAFSNSMTELLNFIKKDKNHNLPLFIMIDELDRCRPNYAIEFLEIIKHLFDIPNITFIIATDSKQLSHAINAVYGNNFASERYLKRFFDQEYTLKTPDNYDYAYYMFEQYGLLEDTKLLSGLDEELYEGKNLNVLLFSKFAEFFKLVPRDINQSIIMLSTITITWDKEQLLHLGYLVFLIMLKQKSNEGFDLYIRTQSFKVLKEEIHYHDLELGVKIEINEKIIDQHKIYEGDKIKSYLISDMLNNYDNLDKFTRTKLDQRTQSKFSMVRTLFMKTKRSEKITAMSYDEIISLTLQQYPNMILQAGQFTSH